MRPNKIREIWKSGGVVANGWLATPAAFTAEGERRPDNRRQADMIQRGHGIIKIIHGP